MHRNLQWTVESLTVRRELPPSPNKNPIRGWTGPVEEVFSFWVGGYIYPPSRIPIQNLFE